MSAQLQLNKPAPQTALNNRYNLSSNRGNEPSCFTAWRLFASPPQRSPLFELALVFVRCDHVADRIVNADDRIM